MNGEPLSDYVLTPHAVLEIRRRQLSEETIRAVLAAPEQRLNLRPGRVVLQSRVSMAEQGGVYLIRVIVDVDRNPAEVVTQIGPVGSRSTGGKSHESLL